MYQSRSADLFGASKSGASGSRSRSSRRRNKSRRSGSGQSPYSGQYFGPPPRRKGCGCCCILVVNVVVIILMAGVFGFLWLMYLPPFSKKDEDSTGSVRQMGNRILRKIGSWFGPSEDAEDADRSDKAGAAADTPALPDPPKKKPPAAAKFTSPAERLVLVNKLQQIWTDVFPWTSLSSLTSYLSSALPTISGVIPEKVRVSIEFVSKAQDSKCFSDWEKTGTGAVTSAYAPGKSTAQLCKRLKRLELDHKNCDKWPVDKFLKAAISGGQKFSTDVKWQLSTEADQALGKKINDWLRKPLS